MNDFARPIYEFKGNQTVSMARHGDDSSVFVEFYDKEHLLPLESEKAGRSIFRYEPYLRITFPGDRTKVWDQPASVPSDNSGRSNAERFPRQWAAYQSQHEQIPDGMPLTQFAAFNRARVYELKAMNIHTIEQYAAVPDNLLDNLGMGSRKERDLCRAAISETVNISQLTELKSENEVLRADVLQLQQQIKELGAMMRDEDDQPKARRGRPPNVIGV